VADSPRRCGLGQSPQGERTVKIYDMMDNDSWFVFAMIAAALFFVVMECVFHCIQNWRK
jgi:hypothetical protein